MGLHVVLPRSGVGEVRTRAAHCWGSGDAENGLVGSKQEDVHEGVKLVLMPVSIGEKPFFEGGQCEHRFV